MMREVPTASPSIPIRALAGIAAVAALALAGALDYSQFLSQYSHSADAFQIGAQEERFRDALAALPPGGVVGYVSDVPPGDPQGQAMLGAAQYALAPHIVVPFKAGGKADWVVGSFTQASEAAPVAAERGLSIVSDYGNGVVLFRRAR
jgi:hypothetical protein